MAQARQGDASSIPPSRGRRPVIEAEETKHQRDVADIAPADAYLKIMSRRVDVIDKDLQMATTLGKQPVMSTGVLTFDLAQGAGGLMPGLHIVVGGEGSAKSTMEMKIMGASLALPLAARGYYDAEGALDRRYTSAVIRTDDFESIFGARDQQGRWYKPALVRYYDSGITEQVFGSIHQVLRSMPDKTFYERNNCWMLRFDRTKPQVALMNDLLQAKVIGTHSKALHSSTGQYWCETNNGAPQAAFFVDSLPQLLPERVESGQNSDNQSGFQALALGKGMRYCRMYCRPKCAIIQAVNQTRKNVRAGPGQPDWYEPGAEAVKFNSDSRWLFWSVVPQGAWDKMRHPDNGGLCREKSVEYEGGFDTYAFKNITCIKNKYGAQSRKTKMRVWTADGSGRPRGIDPVFDTLWFLDLIGVLHGFVPGVLSDWRKRFRIDLPPIKDVEWTYPALKALIIGQDYGDRRLIGRAVNAGAPKFKLREFCFKIIASGRAEQMYIDAVKRSAERKAGLVDLEDEDADGGE